VFLLEPSCTSVLVSAANIHLLGNKVPTMFAPQLHPMPAAVSCQKQVTGEGQANAAFIAALSDRITTYAQQLNTIKQQQRSRYAVLLQEEQQLLEELAVLELTLTDEQLQQEPQLAQAAWPGPAGADLVSAGPARVSTAWEPSCSGSRLSTAQDSSLQAPFSRRSSSSAADCVHRSPDRPNRQGGATSSSASPVKGPSSGSLHAGSCSSSSLPPEVQTYDVFLARHGPAGGWHPDDHKTFLAILKAHRCDLCARLHIKHEQVQQTEEFTPCWQVQRTVRFDEARWAGAPA
jgi:hypothetical protein